MKTIHLADRLFDVDRSSYTGKAFAYTFAGSTYHSIADVARLVLERYARRFGSIKRDKATSFIYRLCNRYAPGSEPTKRALLKDVSASIDSVYPADLRREIALCALISVDKNAAAESLCRTDSRRFVPRNYYEAARATPAKRLRGRLLAELRRDESNLRQCKQIIKTTKEIFNENS